VSKDEKVKIVLSKQTQSKDQILLDLVLRFQKRLSRAFKIKEKVLILQDVDSTSI